MPWTLQRYIFREMGKTFLLAVVALTATMSLGGGVFKMVGLGELTPEQLVQLLFLIVPISAALTLPIAALFAAAATYGRLAADNEFVACRSSGINLHVLFLPTVVLSLFSAAVTFGFWNYMIPGIVQHLDELVATDAGSLVRHRLNSRRGLALGKGLRLTARDVIDDPSRPGHLRLNDVVFIELDGQEWARYGAAQALDIHVQMEATPPVVSARLAGISLFDRRNHRFVDLAEQVLPQTELPTIYSRQIKYLNFNALLRYRRAPDDWPVVRDAVEQLRVYMGRRMVNDHVERSLRADGFVELSGGGRTYTIRSEKPPARVPRDGGIEVRDAVIEMRREGHQLIARADRATIEAVRADSLSGAGVRIDAFDVSLAIDDQSIARAKEVFGPLPIPPAIAEQVAGLSTAELFAPIESRDDRDPIVEAQVAARERRARVLYEITGTMNERAAYSLSVLVLVILSAALGIVFRGSHTVVAFGISFVPSLLVIVTIIMGKQMAQNVGTHGVGLFVLWSGILVVAALDVWTMWRVVRR